jgi:hypothetical protein
MFFKKTGVFVPGMLSQPSLMFVGKARSQPFSLGKGPANFSKCSQNSLQAQKIPKCLIKAQFESPKHQPQTTFEILKYF